MDGSETTLDANLVSAARAISSALGERAVAVVLYGSRARGTAYDDSDTDVAVMLAPGMVPRRSDYRVIDEALGEEHRLSVVVMADTRRPSGFLLELARDARVLWEREAGTVEEIKRAVTQAASEIGAERKVTSSGDPYWVGV